MIYALVYSKGYPYEQTTEVEEFDSLELMTEFVNKTLDNLGKEEQFEILAAYEVRKKVEYEKVEVVTRLKPKEL